MIVGHGIDLTSISRLRAILEKDSGDHFEKRVFSEGERAYCRSRKDPFPHFAARFAAKEAFGKATGLGVGASGDLVEVEVSHDAKGKPFLALKGRALETIEQLKVKRVHLSLTHDGDAAMASVILEA